MSKNLVNEILLLLFYFLGRSSKIVKKVIVPFLLGLKFKTAVLVPLALALIAVKTWKALTLGLLSLVLTGALVVFKLTKPKVIFTKQNCAQFFICNKKYFFNLRKTLLCSAAITGQSCESD